MYNSSTFSPNSPHSQRSRTQHWILLLLLFFSSFVFHLLPAWNLPFSSRGESREAVVVLNMFQQNDFILPLRNGTDIPSKPPLFHWIASGFSGISGSVSEGSIRAASAFCASLVATMFAALALSEMGLIAAIAVFLLTTSGIDWIRYSSLARVDMVFALGVNITLLALLSLLHRWNDKREFSPFLASILVGGTALSVLAKGPAGILLPGATLAFYLGHVWYHHGVHPTRVLPLVRTALVFIVGLVVAASWYYLAFQHRGNEFLATQLFKENFARLTGEESVNVGHEHGFLYAILMLLQDFAPWSLLAPLTGFYVWRILWTNPKDNLAPQITGLFFAIWSATLTAVLMVTASKRSVYFIPAFPAYVYLTVSATYYLNSGGAKVFRGSQNSSGAQNFSGAQHDKLLPRIKQWSEKTVTLMSWTLLVVCAALAIFFISQKSGLSMNVVEQFSHKLKNSFLKDAINLIKPDMLAFFCLLFAAFTAFKARAGENLRQLILLSLSLLALTTIGRLTFFAPLAELATPKYFVASLPAENLQGLKQFKSDFYPFIYYAGQNIPFASLDNPDTGSPGQKFLLWEYDLPLLNDTLGYTARIIARSADLSAKKGSALLIVAGE